ncbi:MAG: DUF1848 domain-containing protein [Fimbriimonadaceae bacterium]|nr:DUF1848 domain-containing protein [Fimbriimonadaceae bacterium]
MIVSASYRTDIPAYYSRWFERRYQAGFCLVPNPFDSGLRRVALHAPEVQGFVFWTRNSAPFMPVLQRLRADGLPCVVQYSLTAYPRALESHGAAPERATALCREVVDCCGAGSLVWRYDPLLVTSLTPPAWHLANFARLAGALSGIADEVVVSFTHFYRKTSSQLRAGGLANGFTFEDPALEAKRELLLQLADLARQEGLRLTVCAQRELLCAGLDDAACIDLARLERLAGKSLLLPRRPHRDRCGCFASVDIGVYDTCPTGCLYCYANRSRAAAEKRRREHRPDDLLLWRPARLTALSGPQLLALATGQEDPHRDQLLLFDDD